MRRTRNKRAWIFPPWPCTTEILGKNAAAARPGRKTRPVPQNSASHESNNRPSHADTDATGQLDILDADDILESDDISAFEAAAAGIVSFEVAPADPSGFEVGDVGEFGDAEVEGALAEEAIEPPPPSLSTFFGMKPKAAPVSREVAAIPAAPVTSPIPLSEPMAERTLEIRRADFVVAAAAAKLEAEEHDAPGHTEVLVRSAMPAAIAIATMHGGMQAPQRRPSSIAPVALDVAAPRAHVQSAPVFPPPARMPSYASMTPPKRGLGGLAVGVIAFSALALVGLVGIGGYAASRAITDPEPVAAANAPESANASSLSSDVDPNAVVAPAPTNAPTNVSPGSVGTGAAIDISALPSSPTPASPAGRGITVRSTGPASAPLAAAGPAAVSSPAGKSAGGALPPPGGGKVASDPLAAPGAPLPPPAPAAAAPAAPATVATTGTVRVDPTLRAVIVDGSFRRPNDGVIVVTCGSHRIKAGMKEQQTVNVPCGGSVSL